jgi:uncharacterized protein (UPF0261 family)
VVRLAIISRNEFLIQWGSAAAFQLSGESSVMAVVLIGTLDTKGRELGFIRDLILAAGLDPIVIDAGSMRPPTITPDYDREEVFRRAGSSAEIARSRGDRGSAVTEASIGVRKLLEELNREGRVDGVLAIGGSAGTVIGTSAMRALPFGIPKVMVSTLASGQVRPYVGSSDIFMLYPVADIAGLNRLTRRSLRNAAEAMIGMVKGASRVESAPVAEHPVIAATMFGVTTPCVDQARSRLEKIGYEVLVFHATGVGGQAMESLIRDGMIDGVLDLTTTELADEVVGGILSAGPTRLEAAGRRGIPQVVSVGAIDMVNFGPKSTVPVQFSDRLFHVHNEAVTLMRTTPSENREIGTRMARILRSSIGPTTVLFPLRGVSALDAPGQPFYDPIADQALFEAIRTGLEGESRVKLVESDFHINDLEFSELASRLLVESM